jgi:hypothetical protein
MCSTPPVPDSPAAIAEREASWWLRGLIAPILFYQRFISPLTPPACRFEPSCSQYTREAIALWGVRGLWLGLKRILRCQPFFEGGHDPVPLPEGLTRE